MGGGGGGGGGGVDGKHSSTCFPTRTKLEMSLYTAPSMLKDVFGLGCVC